MRLSRDLLFSKDTQKLELLHTPIRDLDVSLKDGVLGESIAVVNDDLRRLRFRYLEPNYYLSNGYGVVAGTTNVAVSFFDASELLRELEGEFLSRYTPEEVLMTIRHEVGHAFCYAYKLYRRPDFRKTFNVQGNYFNSYPMTDRYTVRANPWSRDFVNPSGDLYAQKHPDDDWAETFMLVITPDFNWRRKYRDWPGALAKLEYVDWIIKELRKAEPALVNNPEWLDDPVEWLEKTVAQFLRAQTGKYRRRASGYVDPDLKRLFRRAPLRTNSRGAYTPVTEFIRYNRPVLTNQVSQWAGVDWVVVQDLLDKCAVRARALKLVLKTDDWEKTVVSFTTFLTIRCNTFANYGKFFS